MPKATITLPDGTSVTVEGNPEEISRILRLYSGSEEAKAKGQKGAPAGTVQTHIQESREAIAEDGHRRRVSIVWWLSPIILAVLVLGWVGLYGNLNSTLTGVENLNQAASVDTQTAMPGWVSPLQSSTPIPLADCSATKSCTYQDMTLCFSQTGAESDWRTVNSASFKDTAQKLGAQLIFSDGQNKQETQISAVHACVQQKVDVIALTPVVEDGWDAILTEARNAGIPVIIVDRSINADPSLYAAHIGSDMVLEGERAAAEFNQRFPDGASILEISGFPASRAALGRARGFRNRLNANITILDSQTGDFTRAEARSVMEHFLQEYKAGTDFQGVFIHNDAMGIGAIEALEAADVKPGELFIVSVDGTRAGLQAVLDGWFQADVEWNPLMGPQTFELALKLMNDDPVDREVVTFETVFHPEDAAKIFDSNPPSY